MSYYSPQGPPPGPVGPPGPWPPHGGPPHWPPYGGPPHWPQQPGPLWPQSYWPGPPRPSHKPVWITLGVIAAAVVLAVAVFALTGGGGGSVAHRPNPASAEDQIRQTVRSLDDAYNRSDASTLTALMCDQRRESPGFRAPSDAELRRLLQLTGPETTLVNGIVVTGDHATSSVTTTFAKSPNRPSGAEVFVRERGVWKICGRTRTIAS
jgi:hypothetical protein